METPPRRYLPADFSTEDLQRASTILAELTKEAVKDFLPLAKLLSSLHGEIVKELFMRLAKGNPEAEEKLAKMWQEQHGH